MTRSSERPAAPRRIAVIGAGPAGLTSAKQALAGGAEVVVFEAGDDVGGIWNPAGGGAYEGVRLQTSRMAFPFSDFPPTSPEQFGDRATMHAYLRAYAAASGVLEVVRFGCPVRAVVKRDGSWLVTAGAPTEVFGTEAFGTEVFGTEAFGTEAFDAVMVASGELWESRVPPGLPAHPAGTRVLTAKQYRRPQDLAGERVLVVGGGVSGADIASELAGTAASVEWSVRRHQLFLPREIGGVVNDGLLSYAGRVALEELSWQEYLAWLEELMPDYMRIYAATGLLPTHGFHHAVHVNDTIVPAVHRGAVRVRRAFSTLDPEGAVTFADGERARYDAIVLCLGYGMPDYGFLDGIPGGFRRQDLYEHHFHCDDPTLAVVNTPVDTEAFGTACPYFETIAAWVLAVWDGRAALPDARERRAWCAEHMSRLDDRRHFDCWLETIRLGLAAGTLPDPTTEFAAYWTLVSSVVAPDNLRRTGVAPRPAAHDDRIDLAGMRLRVLAALTPAVRADLVARGEIDAADAEAAAAVDPGRQVPPWLPYRMRATAGVHR